MSKRLTAALFALLVFAPALAVVAADPAAAHTKTVQRCSYDPFAGRQCWNEAVRHTHPKPTPPASCPAGMTGTPPSCYPIPNGSGSRTTPEDTTPEDTTPEDTTPEDTTPEDTTPEDTTPEDTTPEDTTPEDTTPEDTTPEDTTPEDTTPEDTTPEDTTPEDTTPEDTTPEDTTPDNDGEPSGNNEPSRTQPKKSTTATTPALCRGPQRRNHHDHGGTVDCHSRGHAPDGHGHGAPSGGSDALKALGDAMHKIFNAPRETLALPPEMTEAAARAAADVLNTALDDEKRSELTRNGYSWAMTQWDSLSATDKVLVGASVCLLVAAATAGGAAPLAIGLPTACGVAISLGDIHLPRPDATPDSTPDATPDSTPDATPDSTPDATPDSTPDSTPDDNNQGDAAPETKVTYDQLRKANKAHDDGLIPIEELRRLQNRYRCQIGYQQYC